MSAIKADNKHKLHSLKQPQKRNEYGNKSIHAI